MINSVGLVASLSWMLFGVVSVVCDIGLGLVVLRVLVFFGL